MLRYILGRILTMLLVVGIVSFLVFMLLRAVPGGPYDEDKYPLSAAAKANIMRSFGFDKPPLVQYGLYMWNAIHLNFGIPFEDPGETITQLLRRAWPVTLSIGVPGIVIAIIAGGLLGFLAAVKQNSAVDHFVTAFSSTFVVIPSYITALLFILVFAVQLGWFDTGGLLHPSSFVLPIAVFSLVPICTVARYMRASVLDVLHQDYVRTARSKGLTNALILRRHVLRNALIPMLTILGPLASEALIGTTFVESVFQLPGVGRYFTQGIAERDYPLVMATTIIFTLLITSIYLVTDVLYVVVDRRVTLGGRRS